MGCRREHASWDAMRWGSKERMRDLEILDGAGSRRGRGCGADRDAMQCRWLIVRLKSNGHEKMRSRGSISGSREFLVVGMICIGI
uniref:Uncharacterized protein n=1 Tax=Oryza nivara TaxID=4536 RepID=A0A0E0FKY0_ORYNI